MHSEGVHPETVGLDGVSGGDVPRDAFVEAIAREDAEGAGEGSFDVSSRGKGGSEFGWAEKTHRFGVGLEGGCDVDGFVLVWAGGDGDRGFLRGDLGGAGGRWGWGRHTWITTR